MLVTILIVTLIISLICFYIGDDIGEEFAIGIGVVSGIIFFFVLIPTIVTTNDVINSRTLTYEIKMYQEENNKIEQDIDTLVKEYMQHENETFNNSKSENSISLVSLYPNLKSDKLVSKQIKIYNDNNEKIKRLKSDKIKSANKKWLLYFGGQEDLEKIKE